VPRKYDRPPLIEAVCEVRFKSSQPWDWTIPGLIYDKIKSSFPKKRQESLLEVVMGPGTSKIQQQVKAGVGKMQFLREDEAALVQIGPDLLSVNQLQPYPEWPAFKSMVLGQIGVYCDIVRPESFSRVGLRYINRVQLPPQQINLEEYFRVTPPLPAGAPSNFRSFLIQVEVRYESPSSCLRYVLGTGQLADEAQLAILLDLDMFGEEGDAPTITGIAEWLDIAHDRIETAFDESFTDKTHRDIFGEVEP
jgi:uncharacterized protein (TIGR04255 family)